MHHCSEGVCDAADCCRNYCSSDHRSGATGDASSTAPITCDSGAGLSMVSSFYQAGCPSTDTNGDGTFGDECNVANCCGQTCGTWTGTCIGAQAGWHNNGDRGAECGTPERERQRAMHALFLAFAAFPPARAHLFALTPRCVAQTAPTLHAA